jgi:hypothetical protein
MRLLCVPLLMLFFACLTSGACAHDLEDIETAYIAVTMQPVRAQPKSIPGLVPLKIEEPLDPSEVAYDLTMSWMKSDEWKKKVKTFKSRFDDWEASTDGDMARYLNDRLICVALGCASGKIESLKDGFAYLALYKEFNQQVPSLVEKIFREHRQSLLKLFAEFTWERASEYVKNKEWRKDAPEKSKK